MNWERLRTQLEEILEVPLSIEHIPAKDWSVRKDSAAERNTGLTDRMEKDGQLYFSLGREGDQIYALVTDVNLFTESEKKLVALAIDTVRGIDKDPSRGFNSDDEQQAGNIRDWIEEQLQGESPDGEEPPHTLAGYSALYTRKIPFLLNCDYSNNKKTNYLNLKKLLESFFDEDVLLVPLMDKEWLILGPESLLTADRDEEMPEGEGLEEESLEDVLASLCSGLHTMMSNEWIGDSHVAAYYPIIPAKSLPSVVRKLREAIHIGRMQRIGQYIHLPWQLYLDQLLHPVPLADKIKFIEQIFKRIDHFMDEETIQTLETFFELDCNVSETARKLFIHRNTLLYRLDKFKQETELDVRSFNQAVHVKIALQLYKITKRK